MTKKQSDNSSAKTFTLFLSMLLLVMFLSIPESTSQQLSLSKSNLEMGEYRRITYMLIHANVLHLAINIYSLLVLVFLSNARLWQVLLSLLVASTLPSELIGNIPILGISVASYALTGLLVSDSSRFWSLLVINALIIAWQAALPGIAMMAHLYGMAVGLSVGLARRFLFSPRYE